MTFKPAKGRDLSARVQKLELEVERLKEERDDLMETNNLSALILGRLTRYVLSGHARDRDALEAIEAKMRAAHERHQAARERES